MGKAEKFDKVQYDNEYIKNNLDIIKFSTPKGEKDKIKKYAEQHGESVSAFIRRAIRLTYWIDSNPGKIPPSDERIENTIEAPEQKQEPETENEKSGNWREDFEEFIRRNEEQQAAIKSARQKVQAPKTWTTPDKLSPEQTEEITRKWLKQQGMDELL